MPYKILIIILFSILINSFAHGQEERKFLKEGNELYAVEKFSEAEINYRKALEKGKEKVKGDYNLGDALYKQGKYNEAATQFQQLSASDLDEKTKARTFHNLGNSLLKANKYEESIQAYKNALKSMPDDKDTKYNLAYAKSKLLQQQQQQKNKEDNKDKKDKDKKKEEENKDDKKDKDDKGEKDKNKEGDKKDKDKEGKESKEDPKDGKDGKPTSNPKQLSQQDAQRILDALNQQERDLQKKLSKKESKREDVEKNW